MLKVYFQDIFKTFKSGNPTEPSFYPDLKKLLDEFLISKGVAPHVTIEERKTESGKPDFVVRKGRGDLVGYVEAKDISIEDLQTVQNTDQIERYKKLPNFILTNYFDFWLWREGKWIKKVRVGMPAALKRVKTAPPPQNEDDLLNLLDAFFSYYIPERKSAKSLAKELAGRAQIMPDYIIHELTDNQTDEIDRIYKAFKDYLIADLTKEDFADIYAQTITYGLFTARLDYPNKKGFDRFIAAQYIPKNIQILHDTFSLISSTALPESISWVVDDIAAVLANADIKAIKEDLRTKKGADDPLIHFYETFLAEYDPKKRKSRGVYYTPLSVVSFITRSISTILKEKFGIKGGLAGENVTLLDPAAGTLTFPAQAIRLAIGERSKQWGPGGTKSFIKDHILKHFHAFELLMAPYVIGHLKISLLLQEFGYKFDIKDKSDRFKLFLTNTLDFDPVKESNLPFSFALSEEAKKAEKVKKEEEILVILGNPPYSSSASEPTKFSKEKMKDYLTGLGVEDEKKKGAIQDEYVRFIRFAHWKIEQAGRGVLGFITNNSYLDGFIHRAMRKKLLETFDEIYILNLHGNLRIKETAPDGSSDENVFDIKPGVAIVLFVKAGESGSDAKVFYQDIWGTREKKYKYLENNSLTTAEWKIINPALPHYLFTKSGTVEGKNYEKFVDLEKIFISRTNGVLTKRDHFVVNFSENSLKNTILSFVGSQSDKKYLQEAFKLPAISDLNVLDAQSSLKSEVGRIADHVHPYLYRPFDMRSIFYHDALISRTRKPLMNNLLRDNTALILGRASKNISADVWDLIFVSGCLSDENLFYRGGTVVIPLYLYSGLEKQMELGKEVNSKESNVHSELLELLRKKYEKQVSSEEIFYYIYTILYSNTYRQKYEGFLKIDFPRIPFTKDYKLFQNLAQLGKELIDLHLLRSPELDEPVAKFYGDGDNLVEKREYIQAYDEPQAYWPASGKMPKEFEKSGIVKINDTQFFAGISPEVWEYHVGGYQVLDKWLKDRKGRELSSEDIKHYCKIVTALQKTLELQKQIDKLYPEVEKGTISF